MNAIQEKVMIREYVDMLVNPYKRPTVVPPRTMIAATLVKSLNLRHIVSITNAAQSSGMFVLCPDENNVIRWYLFSAGRYYLYRIFYFTELLDADFVENSFLNAIVSIKQDNQSLLNTVIGGSIYGVRVEQLPDFRTLRFENIAVSSASHDKGSPLITLAEGITALIVRSRDNSYDYSSLNVSPLPRLLLAGVVSENGVSTTLSNVFGSGYQGTHVASASGNAYNVLYPRADRNTDDYIIAASAFLPTSDVNWPLPGPFRWDVASLLPTIFDTDTAPTGVNDVLWQNAYGHFEVEFNARLTVTNAPTFLTVNIRADHPFIDSAFAVQSLNTASSVTFTTTVMPHAGNVFVVNMRHAYFCPAELARLRVSLQWGVNTPGTVNGSVFLTVNNSTGGMNKHMGSRTLLPYQNLTTGTALQIEALANFEVTPNQALQRNVRGNILPRSEDAYEVAVQTMSKLLTNNMVTVGRQGHIEEMLRSGGSSALGKAVVDYSERRYSAGGNWWAPAARWFKGSVPVLAGLGGMLANEYVPGSGAIVEPLLNTGLGYLGSQLTSGGNHPADDLFAAGHGGALTVVNPGSSSGNVFQPPAAQVLQPKTAAALVTNSIIMISDFRKAAIAGMSVVRAAVPLSGTGGLASFVALSGTSVAKNLMVIVAPYPVQDPVFSGAMTYKSYPGGQLTVFVDNRISSPDQAAAVYAVGAAFQPYLEHSMHSETRISQYVTILGLKGALNGTSYSAAVYAAAARMFIPAQHKVRGTTNITGLTDRGWTQEEENNMRLFNVWVPVAVCGSVGVTERNEPTLEPITDTAVYTSKIKGSTFTRIIVCDPTGNSPSGVLTDEESGQQIVILAPNDIAQGFSYMSDATPAKIVYRCDGFIGLRTLASQQGTGATSPVSQEAFATLQGKISSLPKYLEFNNGQLPRPAPSGSQGKPTEVTPENVSAVLAKRETTIRQLYQGRPDAERKLIAAVQGIRHIGTLGDISLAQKQKLALNLFMNASLANYSIPLFQMNLINYLTVYLENVNKPAADRNTAYARATKALGAMIRYGSSDDKASWMNSWLDETVQQAGSAKALEHQVVQQTIGPSSEPGSGSKKAKGPTEEEMRQRTQAIRVDTIRNKLPNALDKVRNAKATKISIPTKAVAEGFAQKPLSEKIKLLPHFRTYAYITGESNALVESMSSYGGDMDLTDFLLVASEPSTAAQRFGLKPDDAAKLAEGVKNLLGTYFKFDGGVATEKDVVTGGSQAPTYGGVRRSGVNPLLPAAQPSRATPVIDPLTEEVYVPVVRRLTPAERREKRGKGKEPLTSPPEVPAQRPVVLPSTSPQGSSGGGVMEGFAEDDLFDGM